MLRIDVVTLPTYRDAKIFEKIRNFREKIRTILTKKIY